MLKSFLRQYTKGAIIDEAQLVPEVFSAIQVLVDENPHYDLCYQAAAIFF